MPNNTRGKSKRATRKNIIPIRATDAELKEIDDIAESQGLNRSDWLRQQFSSEIGVKVDNPTVNNLIATLQEISQELAPIGNNLNQLTREVNSAVASGQNLPEYVKNPESLNELRTKVQSINQTVKGLILEVKPKSKYRKRHKAK